MGNRILQIDGRMRGLRENLPRIRTIVARPRKRRVVYLRPEMVAEAVQTKIRPDVNWSPNSEKRLSGR